MAGNYWFWHVSERGLVEVYKVMGSAMRATEGVKAMSTRVLALMLGAALLLGREARGAGGTAEHEPGESRRRHDAGQ